MHPMAAVLFCWDSPAPGRQQSGFTCTRAAAELAPRSLLDVSTNDAATNAAACARAVVLLAMLRALALYAVQHCAVSSCPVLRLAVVSFFKNVSCLCCVCGRCLPCIQQRPVAAATHSLPAVGTRQPTINTATTITECSPWAAGLCVAGRCGCGVQRHRDALCCQLTQGLKVLPFFGSDILHVVFGMLSPRPLASAKTVHVQGVCILCPATRTYVDCSTECRLIACIACILSPWHQAASRFPLLSVRLATMSHSTLPQGCSYAVDAMDAAVFI